MSSTTVWAHLCSMLSSRRTRRIAAGVIAGAAVALATAAPVPHGLWALESESEHEEAPTAERIAYGFNARAREFSWREIHTRREFDRAFADLGVTGIARSSVADAHRRLEAGEILLLASIGERPTSGFLVALDSVEPVESGGVRVRLREGRPDPGTMVLQVITHPWALFAIDAQSIAGVRFMD